MAQIGDREKSDGFKKAVPSLIGLACLLSTMLIYSAAIVPFQRFSQTGYFVGPFTGLTLASALFTALIVAILIFTHRRLSTAPLTALACACFCLGNASFLFAMLIDASTVIIVDIGAVLAGIGAALLCIRWGRLLTFLPFKQGIVYISVATIISAVLSAMLCIVPFSVLMILYAICTLIACLTPLLCSQSNPDRNEEQQLVRGRGEMLRSLVDVTAPPALGLFFFGIIVGTMRKSYTESFNAYLLASLAAAALLLAYVLLRRNKRTTANETVKLFIPTLAIILLAVSSITASLGSGYWLAMFCTYLMYMLAAILTIASLCGIAHAREFPSDLVFAAAILLFTTASLAGQYVGGVTPDESIGTTVTIITVVYAALMVAMPYFILRDYHEPKNESDKPVRNDDDANESTTCEQLAKAHGLTKRETEILHYMSKGHSSAYISETLFISPNTVRTHVHNIYGKLGVSSREEVLKITRET